MTSEVFAFILCNIFFLSINFGRRKRLKFDFFDYFLLHLYLMYLVPLGVYYMYPDNQQWARYRFDMSFGSSVLVVSMIFLGGASVLLGYLLARGRRVRFSLILTTPSGALSKMSMLKVSSFIYVALFAFSISLSGGIGEFISEGIRARADNGSIGLIGYVKYLLGGVVIIMIAWLGRWSFYGFKVNSLSFFMFVLFFIFSLVVGVGAGSRTYVLYPFLFLLIYFYQTMHNRYIFYIMLALISALSYLVIVYIRLVYYNYAYGGKMDVNVSGVGSIQEFLVPIFSYFQHYLISIDRSIFDLQAYESPRFYIDYFRVIIDALPFLSWSNGDLDFLGYTSMVAELNKNYMQGDGYVPAGWIAGAAINLWVFGVFFHGFISGYVGGRLEGIIFCIDDNFKIRYSFALIVMILWYSVFFIEDPFSLILGNIGVYAAVCCLLALVKIKKRTV